MKTNKELYKINKELHEDMIKEMCRYFNSPFSIKIRSYDPLKNKKIYYIKKYGENYKEVIQKKWDMRKLNRKLKDKLPVKNIKQGVKKI